jgi:hypothetical protein
MNAFMKSSNHKMVLRTDWRMNDIRRRALESHGLLFDERDCLIVMEAVLDNFDEMVGVNWEVIDRAIQDHSNTEEFKQASMENPGSKI